MTDLSRRGILGLAALPLAAASRSAMTSPSGVPRGLGFVTGTGVSDANFQVNPFLLGTGWDVIIDPAAIAARETEMEIYKIALDGPIGSQVRFAIDGHVFDYVNQGWQNSSSQIVPLKAGQSLQFCWNVAFANGPYNHTSNIQPVVTVWLQRRQGLIT